MNQHQAPPGKRYFALIFVRYTCRYSCHAWDCPAAKDTRKQFRILTENSPQDFDSIEAARAYADEDESTKAGQPTKAIWRVCKCTK